jgi:hypothetical protein
VALGRCGAVEVDEHVHVAVGAHRAARDAAEQGQHGDAKTLLEHRLMLGQQGNDLLALRVRIMPQAPVLGAAVPGAVHCGRRDAAPPFAGEFLWDAGALPRWSNADGLVADLFATGSDESLQPLGTLIGQNFGLHSQGGFSAPYGALVGRIGAGDFFMVGTSYAGTAAATGMLKLFYWDSNAGDNSQYVSASISAVPEPGTYSLLLAGLAAMTAGSRRRA